MSVDLKPYPQYKDSGAPWLGEIPAHWDIVRTKYLFHEVDERSKLGEEAHLSMSQIHGLVESSKIDAWRLQSESHVGGKLCRKNDLVLNRLKAHLGVFAYAPQDGIVSPDYTVFRIKEGNSVRFFETLFKTPAFIAELRCFTKGVVEGFWRLYSDDFYKIRVPIPPKEEQAVILCWMNWFNTRINRFIRNKRSLIKLLNEQKQVIINQAITRGIDSNVTLKPSGISYLGDIPKHWETISLRRIVSKIEQGWSPIAENRLANPDDWGVIKLSAISKGKFLESKHKALGQIPPREKIQIKPGNFLVTRSNTSKLVGEACLVREVSTKLIISDLVYRLSLHLSKVYPEFLNWLWQNPMFRHQISIAAHGSSLSMVKISHQRLLSAILPLPQFKEQVEISEFLQKESQKLDLGIKHAQDEIALIQEYRTRLISDVVTGKIDVRDIEIPALPDEDVVEELDDDALLDAAEAELEAVEDADE